MSYKNKLLLTDGAYRPIPQWYDPDTDTFKPLTNTNNSKIINDETDPVKVDGKVQLTGSNVKLSWAR